MKNTVLNLSKEVGFSNSSIFQASILKFRNEVRDMCAANKCNNYGHCWTCPPGCGTLDELELRTSNYSWGILVQTTGILEDSFDIENMLETEAIHKNKFYNFIETIKKIAPNCLPMATGACELCSECTYPDTPCRRPNESFPSMEAYGLVVSDTCTAANLKYYYGPNTITYSSCILIQ